MILKIGNISDNACLVYPNYVYTFVIQYFNSEIKVNEISNMKNIFQIQTLEYISWLAYFILCY